ncbi:MAG TPA: heterodisulfide reductase-related iron-sulfur binding cluster [Terracidiphilus sp.]|jgi:glycolate oxidase iron-sulfur subunit|nr:heterodisulfide reductase-related iron-sulfur binding cluster [Terracidiphilus sp.]
MPHTTIQQEDRPSSFDAHHPPEKQHIDDCVHCGFCLPACPTYVLWGDEMDSPRGRIYMIKKAAQGEAPLDARFRTHMDNCLGCMACMTACPSGVEYNKLIEPTRAQIERNIPRSAGESLFRKLLFATFPHPARLRLLAIPLRIYQKSGLRALTHAIGIPKLLPKRLAAMESLLPEVPSSVFSRLPATIAPRTAKRRRVGMLSGCVQQVFFPHVNAATARVLAAEGCEVIIPRQQPCCGALMVHSGVEHAAIALAKQMIELFDAAQVDTVVINSAGCGSTMKEYGYLLRDDPAWAARAAAFSARCRDISEILMELEPRAERHPLKLRIAYHDACHLQHAQGVREQPRTLLAGIPDLEVAEIPESSLCCGSAGVYNLLEPDTANQLGDRKVDNLLTTNAQAVLSANPGCLLQLMNGLRRRGMKAMPAFHMVELLDASIRGVSAESLLRGDKTSAIEAN